MKQVQFTTEYLFRLMKLNGEWIGVERSWRTVETMPHQVAFVTDENQPILCGGAFEYWPGRAEAWAIVSKHHRDLFVQVHTLAKRYFEKLPIRRVEIAVECDYDNGHRWANALGFKLECERLQAYLPSGKDCSLYARIT